MVGRSSGKDSLGHVTLDLDWLVASGAVRLDEARRLSALGVPSRINGTLVSVLYIIGALGVAAGVVALNPTATTGLVLALIALAGGWFIRRRRRAELEVLGMGLGIMGALGLCGWLALEFGEAWRPVALWGVATAIIAAVALAFRSSFLAALVPLGIGAMAGSGTAYWHATYAVFVREPTVTFVLFTALAASLYAALPRIRAHEAALGAMATVAARMSFVLANFALWVGSLWGDHVGEHLSGIHDRAEGTDWTAQQQALEAWRAGAFHVPELAFVLVWAAFAIAAVAVGQRRNLRFLVNGGVVFLAINAYTQFFERFHAEEWALILGGGSMVALAVLLVRFPLLRWEPGRA